MANIVQVEAQALLNASIAGTTYTLPTGIKVYLLTAIGSSTSAGTEVTGASYARQTFTPGSASAATPSIITHTNAISFTGMPAVTVTSLELWDIAGTPVRRWFGLLAVSKTLGLGDTISFAIGAITVSLG